MTNRPKQKRVSLAPTDKPPRALDEIQKEYAEYRIASADAQYQAYLYTKQLETINAHMERLNHEASARIALDKEAAPKAAEGASNVTA
jgi:hypothetical protein